MTLFLPRHLDKLPTSTRDIEYNVHTGDTTVVEIFSDRSRFKGKGVASLDRQGRRSLENLFVLSYPQERMIFRYV